MISANRIRHYAMMGLTRLTGVTQEMEVRRYWAEELARTGRDAPKRLLRYGYKVYSQHEEDGIIEEIFTRIGPSSRRFIEIGVESGVECNTVRLLVDGWRGLWIEGDKKDASRIRRRFSGFLERNELTLAQAFVTAENCNELINKHDFGGDIDLLSIDIDGNDYWVWKALVAVQPRVLVVEYNAALGPSSRLVKPYDPAHRWDGSNYFGASLAALCDLAGQKGFQLVGCNFSGSNAFFVRRDLCGDHFELPATAVNHYEPPRYFFALLRAGHASNPGRYQHV